MTDQLLNPTLIVGIGEFGSRVADKLEKRARDLADLWGTEAVRNFATLRIQTVSELRQTHLRGALSILGKLSGSKPGEPGRCEFDRFKSIWIDPTDFDELPKADTPDASLLTFPRAYRGLDPDDHTGFESAELLIKQALVELIKVLFQVEEFVEFHPDFSEFASRLDVYVVGRFDCTGDGDLIGGDKALASRTMSRFLEEHAHLAIMDAMSELVKGPLSTLFRPHQSNLSLTHIGALPVLESAATAEESDGAERARRTFGRYILRRHEAWERDGWYVPGRFVIAEDRSFRYVLNEEQLQDQVEQFISLLSFRRRGSPKTLRDLVQPLPDIDRSRSPIEHITRICGAFSTAVAETPVDDMIRYCRTKQAIGVGNRYLDRRGDERYTGDIDANDRYVPPEPLTPQLADEVYQMYGPSNRTASAGGMRGAKADFTELEAVQAKRSTAGGRRTVGEATLDASGSTGTERTTPQYALQETGNEAIDMPRENVEDLLDDELNGLRDELDREVEGIIRGRFGLGDWGMPKNIDAWMHQDRVVTQFHPDLDEAMLEDDNLLVPNPFEAAAPPSTSGQLTEAWLHRQIQKFYGASAFIIENKARDIFVKVERNVQQRCQEWINLQQAIIDARVDASPAGWRSAHAALDASSRLIDKRIRDAKEALEAHSFEPLPPILEEITGKVDQQLSGLMSAADSKPIYQRAAWTAVALGLSWGLGLGALATLAIPFSLGNIAIAVVPSMLLMAMLGWYWIKDANRQVADTINGYIDPAEGSIPKTLDEGKDRIFLVSDKRSWFGQRIEWSVLLWKLRFWRRLRLKLGNDLICLSDVGTSIENGIRGYRDDQQDLKVRFYEEQSRWLEENDRLFSDDTQFMHSMADAELADQLFQQFGVEARLLAEQYQDEEDPMHNWREQPPMAERGDLQAYCRSMFEVIEGVDFLRHPEYREIPRRRMRTFLQEYAYKLSLLSEDSMAEDTGLSSMSTYVVTHPENMPILESLSPAENWPGPWELEAHSSNRHFVAFVRHAQGLSPWEMPAFGTLFDHLRTLVELEAFDTVAAVVARIRNPAARKLAAAQALHVLATLPEVERPSLTLVSEPPAPMNLRLTSTEAPVDLSETAGLPAAESAVEPVDTEGTAVPVGASEDTPDMGSDDALTSTEVEDDDALIFAGAGDSPEVEESEDDLDLVDENAAADRLAEDAQAEAVLAARRRCAEAIIDASTGTLNDRFQPVDVERLIPAAEADRWMASFRGDPRLIDMVAVLYGTAKDPNSKVTPASVEVRRGVLVNAADGQIPLAYKAVRALPSTWRDEALIHRLHADLVRSTIDRIPFGIDGVDPREIEQLYGKVLRIADHVHPWTLRSRTILKNAVYLFQIGRADEARCMLELDRIPLEARPKGDLLDIPEVNELVALADALGRSTALVTNLLNCYGEGAEFADEIPVDLTRMMLALHPRGRPGLLELLSGYPAGCLSSRFVGAIKMTGDA